MKNFWNGFEKRGYEYHQEAKDLKNNYDWRSKQTPMSGRKAGLVGAGIGGVLGAMVGGRTKKLPGALLGGLLGAGAGGLLGVSLAIADELGIDEAKHIMRMKASDQKVYLQSLARKNEISSTQAEEWYRDLRKERLDSQRHDELIRTVSSSKK